MVASRTSPDSGLGDLRLDEQAALRRVATAVARQRTPDEIFAVVTDEAGELFGATASTLFRFEGAVGVGMSDWHTPEAQGVPKGLRVDLTLESATGRVYQTGAPARVDSYDEIETERIDAPLRSLGIRAAVAAPIVVDGRIWGSISLSTVRPRPFPPGTERRLGAFAELVGQAVANAEARRQLRESRVRIVEAADEARRRIERDLHDGAQQRLVSLALRLQLARRTAGDAEATRAAIDGCSEELATALAELRELANGIHPAMLTERGLAPALQSVADRAPVPVELDVQLPERLAPAHEAALYFTACEALANVSKHAQASRASIRARQENGSVVIEIADDGVGGAEPSRGERPAWAERPARCGRGHAARRERRRSRHPRDRDATGRRGGSRLTTSTVTCNLQVTMNSKLTMMTTGAVADAAAPSLVAIARGGRGSGVVLTPGRVLVGTHGVRAERLAISRGDGDVVPATLLAHDADRSPCSPPTRPTRRRCRGPTPIRRRSSATTWSRFGTPVRPPAPRDARRDRGDRRATARSARAPR